MNNRRSLVISLVFVFVVLIAAAVIFDGERYLPAALIAVGFWTVMAQRNS